MKSGVVGAGDQRQVVRIDAAALLTFMVEQKSLGHVAIDKRVGKAMGEPESAAATANPDISITTVERPVPDPTVL